MLFLDKTLEELSVCLCFKKAALYLKLVLQIVQLKTSLFFFIWVLLCKLSFCLEEKLVLQIVQLKICFSCLVFFIWVLLCENRFE